MDKARAWPALEVSLGAGETPSDLFQAALTDYTVTAIDETDADRWRVFFSTPAERDRAVLALRERFPELTIQPVDVADDDWAARSQANLRAIRVGNVIVAPPWDVPLVITIQPSMGFGTAHHATTRLCLSALQRIDFDGLSALDVGTGSGVLAIAASLLGADPVTGIDNDEDAIHAAWENLALNPSAVVTLLAGDVKTTALGAADLVLANLTGALLIAASEPLQRLTTAGGRLVLSGFTTDETRDVLAAFPRWSVEYRDEEDGWVAVTLRHS